VSATASTQVRAGRVVTVVVLDPHPTYAHGLAALLASVTVDIRVTGVACTPEDGEDVLASCRPEVVVLGVGASGSEDTGLRRLLRQVSGGTKVLVLIDGDPAGAALEWLRLGVDGYLGKDAGVDQLVSALRVISTGGVVVARPALDSALAAHPVPTPLLREEEQQLLHLVLDGLSNAQIARRIAVSESTLKRTLHRLVEKLHARDRTHAALLAQQRGLL
jgi:DNA-binding NarL/FixJ family response regulator